MAATGTRSAAMLKWPQGVRIQPLLIVIVKSLTHFQDAPGVEVINADHEAVSLREFMETTANELTTSKPNLETGRG